MDARSEKITGSSPNKREDSNTPAAKFALFIDLRRYAPKVRSHNELTFSGDDIIYTDTQDTTVNALKANKNEIPAVTEMTTRKRRQGRTTRKTTKIEKQSEPTSKTDKEYNFRIVYGNDGTLEAYSSAVCQLLAGREYVASANAYHDANGYTGIAYKTIANCKSNHERPLTSENTKIGCMRKEELRCNIIGRAKNLLTEISKNESPGFFSGLFSEGLNNELAAVKMQLNFIIDKFEAVMSQSNRIIAVTILEKYFSTPKNQKRNPVNILLLSKILDSIQAYLSIPEDHKEINIETIEAALVVAKKKEIDLDALKEDEQIKLFVNHRNIIFKVRDLKNYLKIKGLAIAFTTQYLQHGEMNNTSFTNDGRMLDFGMTNIGLHFLCRDISPLDFLLRSRHHSTLAFTERDIQRLPVLTDRQPYYWPTLETSVPPELTEALNTHLRQRNGKENRVITHINHAVMQFTEKSLSWLEEKVPSKTAPVKTELGYLKIIGDLFNETSVHVEQKLAECASHLEKAKATDNKHFSTDNRNAFSELEHHPVFVFFKYKTILKYLLTDKNLHRRLAELYLSEDKQTNNQPLSEQIAANQENRVTALRKIVCAMPEFNNYLTQHGNPAFAMIREEFDMFAKRQQRKSLRHPNIAHYSQLAAAIDVDEMAKRFNALKARQPSFSRLPL